MKNYLIVSGIIFGVVAVLHALRLALNWQAQIGAWGVPMWASWIGIVVSGALCVWAFQVARASRPPS
jgi:hypothetical protein